jgi:arylsulfatase A
LDGRSFFPQLRGRKGQPRDWIYSWYSPRQSADLTVREFTFNHRFKLYRTGEFFDLGKDVEEKHPLAVAALQGEAAAAAKMLQGALDQYRDARPAALDRALEQAGKPPSLNRRQRRKRSPSFPLLPSVESDSPKTFEPSKPARRYHEVSRFRIK